MASAMRSHACTASGGGGAAGQARALQWATFAAACTPMSFRNSRGGIIVSRRVAALSPFALLLSVFTGCASQQHMNVRVMAPAVVDLGGYKLVALDRLEGDGSSEVTAELADALRAARDRKS